MRAIICGAGAVGHNIASYLAREKNDVIVIDTNVDLIAEINTSIDAKGIVGHAAIPDVLAQAGAQEADIIIAVTDSDEVNMVACQIAHSLFNVPKKIARIRNQSYADPAWGNLFSRAHIPIDIVISPEKEAAQSIYKRLKTPGTTNVYDMADGLVQLAGVICKDNCPLLNTQLKQLPKLFPNLPIVICLIIRDGLVIVPNEDDQLIEGDEAYFFTDTEHLKRSLAIFGHEEKEARHIVILGGGGVGVNLLEDLLEENSKMNVKMIEYDADRARYLSEHHPNVIVLHGDGLKEEIIREANIQNAETLVAVTNDDETNILGSLLAKQHGCERVVTLVNNPSYTSLINSLGIDAIVSPRLSTVSTIMQHVRRGRIKELHSIYDGAAEIIEAEVSESSDLVNMELRAVNLPDDVIIGVIVRNDTVIIPTPNTTIQPDDHLIIMTRSEHTNQVEDLFTIQVDLF
jgi:trk system potassium uptake protein TrkA